MNRFGSSKRIAAHTNVWSRAHRVLSALVRSRTLHPQVNTQIEVDSMRPEVLLPPQASLKRVADPNLLRAVRIPRSSVKPVGSLMFFSDAGGESDAEAVAYPTVPPLIPGGPFGNLFSGRKPRPSDRGSYAIVLGCTDSSALFPFELLPESHFAKALPPPSAPPSADGDASTPPPALGAPAAAAAAPADPSPSSSFTDNKFLKRRMYGAPPPTYTTSPPTPTSPSSSSSLASDSTTSTSTSASEAAGGSSSPFSSSLQSPSTPHAASASSPTKASSHDDSVIVYVTFGSASPVPFRFTRDHRPASLPAGLLLFQSRRHRSDCVEEGAVVRREMPIGAIAHDVVGGARSMYFPPPILADYDPKKRWFWKQTFRVAAITVALLSPMTVAAAGALTPQLLFPIGIFVASMGTAARDIMEPYVFTARGVALGAAVVWGVQCVAVSPWLFVAAPVVLIPSFAFVMKLGMLHSVTYRFAGLHADSVPVSSLPGRAASREEIEKHAHIPAEFARRGAYASVFDVSNEPLTAEEANQSASAFLLSAAGVQVQERLISEGRSPYVGGGRDAAGAGREDEGQPASLAVPSSTPEVITYVNPAGRESGTRRGAPVRGASDGSHRAGTSAGEGLVHDGKGGVVPAAALRDSDREGDGASAWGGDSGVSRPSGDDGDGDAAVALRYREAGGVDGVDMMPPHHLGYVNDTLRARNDFAMRTAEGSALSKARTKWWGFTGVTWLDASWFGRKRSDPAPTPTGHGAASRVVMRAGSPEEFSHAAFFESKREVASIKTLRAVHAVGIRQRTHPDEVGGLKAPFVPPMMDRSTGRGIWEQPKERALRLETPSVQSERDEQIETATHRIAYREAGQRYTKGVSWLQRLIAPLQNILQRGSREKGEREEVKVPVFVSANQAAAAEAEGNLRGRKTGAGEIMSFGSAAALLDGVAAARRRRGGEHLDTRASRGPYEDSGYELRGVVEGQAAGGVGERTSSSAAQSTADTLEAMAAADRKKF